MSLQSYRTTTTTVDYCRTHHYYYQVAPVPCYAYGCTLYTMSFQVRFDHAFAVSFWEYF